MLTLAGPSNYPDSILMISNVVSACSLLRSSSGLLRSSSGYPFMHLCSRVSQHRRGRSWQKDDLNSVNQPLSDSATCLCYFGSKRADLRLPDSAPAEPSAVPLLLRAAVRCDSSEGLARVKNGTERKNAAACSLSALYRGCRGGSKDQEPNRQRKEKLTAPQNLRATRSSDVFRYFSAGRTKCSEMTFGVLTLALPVLWRMCTSAHAISSLFLTLIPGSSTEQSSM